MLEDRASALDEFRRNWPNASLTETPSRTEPVAAVIFSGTSSAPLTLHLRGTNFQLKVWEALLHLPPGGVTTYQRLADRAGMPQAARAVGNAVGHNPVAYLIPCHRVLRELGSFGQYRYGAARKKAMLLYESGAE